MPANNKIGAPRTRQQLIDHIKVAMVDIGKDQIQVTLAHNWRYHGKKTFICKTICQACRCVADSEQKFDRRRR